jgi:excisionase family DNA binding protein
MAARPSDQSALLVVSPQLATHLSRALSLGLPGHKRWCRANGIYLPEEDLATVLDLLGAIGGNRRPERDARTVPAEAVLVTYADAARVLRCSRRTVRRRVARGELQAVGRGSGRRIAASELERFTAEGAA